MEVTEETATTEPEVTEAPDAPHEVVPPSERPESGFNRELARLTPVEVDHGKAVYRQILPG